MIFDKLKVGTVTIDVNAPIPEKFLNILWNKRINISNVVRLSVTNIRLDIDYADYKEVEDAVKKCKGKVKVVGRYGGIFLLMKIKRQATLFLGIGVFLVALYFLSTFVWAIEINTEENVAPFQIRKQLSSLGVKPGIRKSDLNVYDLEKKLEGINGDILWLRARVEGSTLKIKVEEKVNPPEIAQDGEIGDCTAKIGGEIKRIYITSGTANVSLGDIVEEGQVLIKGIQGKEGEEYEVPAKGTVIANTFYEKKMTVQVSGTKTENTGKKDKDIYLDLFGKKIYLKKAIKNFKYCDKIEDNNGLVNIVTYFERGEKEVNIDKDEAMKLAVNQLKESLTKILTNDAKIIDEEVNVIDVGDGKIEVTVDFVVEQDIVNIES